MDVLPYWKYGYKLTKAIWRVDVGGKPAIGMLQGRCPGGESWEAKMRRG